MGGSASNTTVTLHMEQLAMTKKSNRKNERGACVGRIRHSGDSVSLSHVWRDRVWATFLDSQRFT